MRRGHRGQSALIFGHVTVDTLPLAGDDRKAWRGAGEE